MGDSDRPVAEAAFREFQKCTALKALMGLEWDGCVVQLQL
jgi:hypothetical protein